MSAITSAGFMRDSSRRNRRLYSETGTATHGGRRYNRSRKGAMRRWTLTVLVSLLGVACNTSSTTPTKAQATTVDPVPSPPSARPFTLLVVTHTTGFRHSSIAVAEPTIASLGDRSNLFSVRYCRNANDVAAMLTADA